MAHEPRCFRRCRNVTVVVILLMCMTWVGCSKTAKSGGGGASGGNTGNTGGLKYPQWYLDAKFPQYPGARVLEVSSPPQIRRVHVETNETGNLPKIAAFYREQFKALGWTEQPSTTDPAFDEPDLLVEMTYTKGESRVKVSVAGVVKAGVVKPTRVDFIQTH